MTLGRSLTIILPLWGESYVKTWRDFSLPSFLAPGNLPALSRNFDIKFRIYTSAEDVAAIDEARGCLSPFCRLEPYIVGTRAALAQVHPGAMMTRLHQAGYDEALAERRGILYLVGDSLFSDGLYATVARHILEGVDAVVTQGTHVREEAARRLAARYTRAGVYHDTCCIIPPRELVRAVLEDQAGENFPQWHWRPFVAHPSHVNWLLRDQDQRLVGMLMRWFHVFPLYLAPLKPARIRWSIDNDLLEQLTTPERCAWIQDSDEGTFVDTFRPGKVGPHDSIEPPPEASIDFMARWCRSWARDFGLEAFRRPIVLTTVDKPEDLARNRGAFEHSREIAEAIVAKVRGQAAA